MNLLATNLLIAARLATQSPLPVSVTVDTAATPTPFDHYWTKSFGSGHARLTTRADWRAQLVQAIDELGLRGVRYHGMFDDDMGVVGSSGRMNGKFEYNFSALDDSWDFQVMHNVKPIIELSFMPELLANCRWENVTGQPPKQKCNGWCGAGMEQGEECAKQPAPGHGTHYRGVEMMPEHYEDWYDLVRATVAHVVERYGLATVQTWHFECWNELWGMPRPRFANSSTPNASNSGTYIRLYNASAHAVKSVDASLKVGGPATAGLGNLADFVNLSTILKIPFDFVSTHAYPTDRQTCPSAMQGGAGWDPSCFQNSVTVARTKLAALTDVPLFLTEYNVGCCMGYAHAANPHDTAGAAAFVWRQVAALHGVVGSLSCF